MWLSGMGHGRWGRGGGGSGGVMVASVVVVAVVVMAAAVAAVGSERWTFACSYSLLFIHFSKVSDFCPL